MGRKKQGKKTKKPRAEKNTNTELNNNKITTVLPENPDLSHLSGEWQEFYRRVIDRIS